MRRNEKKQKRKFLSRVMAMVAAITLTAVSVGTTMPVQAANIAPKDNLATTFNKYLVMDENANVPKVEFSFTITPGTAVAATSSSPAIYAGIGVPKINTAVFNPGDQTTEGKPEDTLDNTTKGFKYATKEVTVDFNDVSFTAPGIYRYTITETAVTQDGIINDTNSTRTLDVHVNYKKDSEDQLEVSNYALYAGKPPITTEDFTTKSKSEGFTNQYETQNLTLEKQVTGNQGDRDKYFKFTVEITNAVEGTKYTVNLQNAEAKPTVDGMPETNAATLIATQGSVTETYYLKDDQSIVIQGLTAGTNYTITEDTYTSDGYKTSYVIDSNEKVEASDTGEQNMKDSDHKVTFTNNKEGTVPTGILLETAPYIVLAVVVLAGLTVLFMTRRRHER